MGNICNKEKSEIDFVILWVDNSDPKWLEDRSLYQQDEDRSQNRNDARFRDWGILKYWFRSVELYAPWVRKIHFVTCGHYPDWLNLEHPKLHFVKHEEFIPKEYLPTFSTRPIELNIHRIKGLSEQFVYFNDDMFVVAPVYPTDFFKKGLPRDVAVRKFSTLYDIRHININCIEIINKRFFFKYQFKENLWKWINYRYGWKCLWDLYFLPFGDFTGAYNAHVANAYKKEIFFEVWEKYGNELHNTCLHRFRSKLDVNQWVFKFWQIVSGKFYPQWIFFGKYFLIDDVEGIQKILKQKRTKLICINDNESIRNIQELKERIIGIFQKVFPEKSSYEK